MLGLWQFRIISKLVISRFITQSLNYSFHVWFVHNIVWRMVFKLSFLKIEIEYFSVALRNLLANPFNCNCHLAWLGDWLRKKRIVTGNPRCQKPYFLKEIPIQDVAIQDFTCDDGKKINIWTFYDFSFHTDNCMIPIDPKMLCFK